MLIAYTREHVIWYLGLNKLSICIKVQEECCLKFKNKKKSMGMNLAFKTNKFNADKIDLD
jgi:hypothetical protein